MSLHIPVLLDAAIQALAIYPNDWFIDATFGRGGHSKEILNQLSDQGRLWAFDRDWTAINSNAARELVQDRRFCLQHGCLSELQSNSERLAITGKIAGILLDLGVSSPQLDEAERGFSFLQDGPLDMRMNAQTGMTAAEWLASTTETELTNVLRDYGEERFAKRIAHAIVANRIQKPLKSTRQLAQLIDKVVPFKDPHKHPATRSFQAIRIFINQELKELQIALQQAINILAPGGRLVVITFHSLEDRLVKRFIRDEARGHDGSSYQSIFTARKPRLRQISKPQLPDELEIARNPRARSAILRVAERLV